MANAPQPPNPYAPTDALAHDVAADPDRPRIPWPRRVGAAITAILCYPLPGPGFLILGRRRGFTAWVVAGVLAWALLIAAVWLPVPRLSAIAMTAMGVLWLTSLLATAVVKPGDAGVKRAVLTGLLLIVAVRGGFFAMKVWAVEAFKIPSGTMVPTLLVGDHVLIKKTRAVQRGDVIVFKFPQDESTDYIKRVVAVGGDTIEVRGGVTSINGVPLDQQPIDEPCKTGDEERPSADLDSCKFVRETNAGRVYTIMLSPEHPAIDHPRTVVPPGELFVMGDNRDNSYDSRRWGTLRIDLVKGIATVTYLSEDPKSGVRWSRIGHRIQ